MTIIKPEITGGYLFKKMAVVLALTVALGSGALAESAPDFTLKSRSGDNVRLEELRGDVVMLNFWASWCGPCRQEMPHMDDIQKEFEDYGFHVVAVNVDQNRADADRFLAAVPVDFTILFDEKSDVSQLYQVQAMPTTVMIDRDGQARFLHRGYQPGYEDKYRAEIRQLIRE